MPGAVRNGAKIGFPGVKVGISGGFCPVLGTEGCFCLVFRNLLLPLPLLITHTYISIFSAVCIFTRKNR